MKLAYAVTTPEATSSVMGFSGNFEEDLKKIKECGYDAVELLVRDPKEFDADYILDCIKKNGLSVAAIGTNPCFNVDGLFIISDDEEVMEKAMERTKSLIDFAAKAGGVPVGIGKYRGFTGKYGKEKMLKMFEAKLKELSDYAKEKGAFIVVEPHHSGSVDNINTVGEAVEFIKKAGADGTKVLYDFYHGDVSEETLLKPIYDYADYIGFIHCSDRNRKNPAEKIIDIKGCFDAIKEVGYKGDISMEFDQTPNSYEAAKNAADVLKTYM